MESYTAQDIQVLTGLEPVRKRPGLYIGSVDSVGLHHLIWEILDNSIDEVMNGYATWVELELDRDGRSIRITDNGRGIPVDIHKDYGKSALELIMTTLHAGGKFAHANYTYSGGLHGVGASVVNALSERLEVTVKRDGGEWFQSYVLGQPTAPVMQVGQNVRGSGTSIWFRPDEDIFEETIFDPKIILETLEARAWLHKVKIIFKDRVNGITHKLDHSDSGLDGYLKQLVGNEPRASAWEDYIFAYKREENIRMEAAVLWSQAGGEQVRSFVNGINTPQGGTHELGLKAGLVKAVRNYMEIHNLQPKGVKLSAEDIRCGLRAIIAVYIADPQFKGQTKERLNNTEVNGQVAAAVAPAFERCLNENPSIASGLIDRIVLSAKERAAAAQASETVVRKSVTRKLNLPGKLADCSSNRTEECELFIVEGDSAGGSAKQGRDRRFQAILPLRGKILNIEHAGADKIGQNKEIANLISAIGCGVGSNFSASKLRYGRIVVLTDADSDGHHIACLLVTFFYRFMPELIKQGHVYLGRPPLYRVQKGKTINWAWTEEERESLSKNGRSKGAVQITRFKGLGEMSPEQLKATTLDPDTRTIFRVVVNDEKIASETISECFGRDVTPRYKLIMEHANEADEIDV
ncbi:MAG: type IIA DNA topoisomerase subunit B [Candidatus Bruticola sp.]